MVDKIRKGGDIPIMDMDKSCFIFPPKLIITTKINRNIDGNVNIYKKRKECHGCGAIPNSAKLFSEHIRNGDYCII